MLVGGRLVRIRLEPDGSRPKIPSLREVARASCRSLVGHPRRVAATEHLEQVRPHRVQPLVFGDPPIPLDRREQFEARFASRAGQVSNSPGFEAFELMRPTEGGRYLVYTRWATHDDFNAWRNSTSFAGAHRAEGNEGAAQNSSEVWTFEVLQGEYASDC